MKVTPFKRCRCLTCGKAFHYLGIARHRAAHRSANEFCEIRYTDGRVYQHDYAAQKDVPDAK